MVLLVVVVVVVGEEDIEIHPLVFWLRWCDPEPDNIKLEGGWGGGRSASPPDAGVLAAEPVSFRRHFKNNIKLELVFSLQSLAELLRFATLPLSILDEASQSCWVLQFFHFCCCCCCCCCCGSACVVVVVVAEEDIEIHPLVFWLRWCDPEPDNIKLEGGWGGGRSASPQTRVFSLRSPFLLGGTLKII